MANTNRKHLVQQQFSQNPRSYVTSVTHASGADLVRLLELVNPQPGWRMLDLATGGGHTALTFAPYVNRVIASDLTTQMLHAASDHISGKGLQNVCYIQLDAEAIPFAGDSFDLVTCRIAAHHFPQLQQFVAEAVRVTIPGGLVVVVDQIMPKNRKAARYVNAFERLRDPSHAWAYSLPRWTGFLKDTGLEVLHTEPFSRRHRLAEWAARMHCAPDVVTRLQAMLIQAPEKAAAWLEAEVLPGGESFLIHQAIMIGRKPTS